MYCYSVRYFEVTETRENWLYIKCEWDDFRGWVEESGILLVTPAFFREACDMNVIAREHHLAFEYSKPEHPYRILLAAAFPSIGQIISPFQSVKKP